MELYRVEQLTFAYPGQTQAALDSVSFSVVPGEFLTLCGTSGSGKSTLLRQLKTALAASGVRSGRIFFDGRPLDEVSLREQAARIGFVQQCAENQLVTDKVWHELAFGLESLGTESAVIRRRVAEMAAFFGMEDWFYRDVATLSGGQKQLLNLAAVLTTQPDVLILDEPTAQLDPIAAEEFLSALARVNRTLGTTILLSEQRLEETLPLSGRMLVLENGRRIADGTPHEVGGQLCSEGREIAAAMPSAMRIWSGVDPVPPCPVSVREGAAWLAQRFETQLPREIPLRCKSAVSDEAAAVLDEVWFRYEKQGPDVVKGLSLCVHKGELLAVLGGNGAGKTTMLKLLAGIQKPYRGSVSAKGTSAFLPQDPQLLFHGETLRLDLLESGADHAGLSRVAALCHLEGLLDRHPYDLSGGEQQRAALAKLLLADPELLILDEPTKGLDAVFKRELAALLRSLCTQGTAVLMVSHDVEFCAEYADRCALFFDGKILTDGTPQEFFAGNSFYTTAANRMARRFLPHAVTVSDVISACGVSPPEKPMGGAEKAVPAPRREVSQSDALPHAAEQRTDCTGKMRALSAAIWLLIPLTLFAGSYIFHDRKYYAVSLLILLEAMLPFFLLWEGRRPKVREMVVLSVLCALGVAGRAAFFMLPQCKPVLALTIVTGASLGGEAGFLVGAVTMLVSNMLFAQGPWTPWQMFGMGAAGFLAGVWFHRAGARRTRGALCLYGIVSAIVVYGGILNASSALLAAGTLNKAVLLSYYASGFPVDCVHAGATAVFLWLFAEPMLEKLARVKKKYGLRE